MPQTLRGKDKREGERRRAGSRQRRDDGQGGREAKTNSLVTDPVRRRWKWASFPCTLQEVHAAEGGHVRTFCCLLPNTSAAVCQEGMRYRSFSPADICSSRPNNNFSFLYIAKKGLQPVIVHNCHCKTPGCHKIICTI